jgi:general secretion pathway protein E
MITMLDAPTLLAASAHPAAMSVPSLSGALGFRSVMPLLGEAFWLVSAWKPVLLLLPFIPWAIIVSKVLDKHAARYYLPRTMWNVVHMSSALLALLVALVLPLPGQFAIFVAFAIVAAILAIDVAAFVLVTNKDERVPETKRLSLNPQTWMPAKTSTKKQKVNEKIRLVLRAADKSTLTPPTDAESPEFQVRVAAESVYVAAMDARAAQVEIAPTGKDNAYATLITVDGVRQQVASMPGADAVKVMDLWKVAAKLDVNDRRRKQTADITVDRGDNRKKVRVTSIGSQAGMRLTLLIDPAGQVKRKIADLGLFDTQLKELEALVSTNKGVVLVAGPADAGRTSTMYAIVRAHDAYTKNVNTLELEIQDEIEGVRQNLFDPQADSAEFSTTTRSLLRRDPDVLALAELPDAATAKEVARADGERCRVYVGLRAETAMQAIQQYVKAVGDQDMAMKHLVGVVSHRLIRTVCTNCRVPYQPTPDMLKKMGVPPDRVKQLYKKGGQVLIKNKPEVCPMCQGVGYYGQTGLFEIITLSDADKAMLKAGDANGFRAELRKRNVLTIQQAALRKAIEGATSVEEVGRVTAEATPAPVGGAPANPAGQAAPAAAKA